MMPTPSAPRKPAPSATGLDAALLRKALRHLRGADPNLALLIKRVGPCKLQVNTESDLFLSLAESIVFQQLHGKAAATIFGRLCALFPRAGGNFSARDIARCKDEKLRGAGLSQNKLLALRDLSGKVLDGTLPTMIELPDWEDERIIDTLTQVRGIGRWTVEMLLMFRLGRPDVLAINDFGLRKGFMLTQGLDAMPTPKELQAHGECWAPYRSVASWYLWRATDGAL
ncbi:MAG TPA: hypothetical protein VNR18_06610 [Hyphomicrobiales bacterium]|nr:hypothetical protein [Hyphomicrobiales bacterium]